MQEHHLPAAGDGRPARTRVGLWFRILPAAAARMVLVP
jgi:hypothetical protein